VRIKSYFADSVQEAVESARRELGPEAMLVNSRKTEPELRQLGAYEVVFGVLQKTAGATEPVAGRAKANESARADDAVVHELADLRRQIETIGRSLSRNKANSGTVRYSPELDDLSARLLSAGFSPEFLEEFIAGVELRLHAENEKSRQLHNVKGLFSNEAVDRALSAELSKRIQVSTELGHPQAGIRVVMLVGAPGAGKTTTLVKLALRYGLKERVPVDILSTDAFRIGAWEQLSRYARIAGATFETLQSVPALASVLDRRSSGRLILIDTPGYGLGDMQEAADWAQFARRAQVDVHLVMPATLRIPVAMRMFEQFRSFGASKLVLTHWDEVENTASAVELALRIGAKLSFISYGQQIPEDLREANAAELEQEFMVRGKSVAVSAA